MSYLDSLTNTKRGMLIAVVAMFAYIPLAGIMTSYSSIAKEMQEHYGLNSVLQSALNSVAFGITVGLCPFSSLLFLKYGYRPIAMVGFCGAALSLLVSALTTNQYVLFFSYSIAFATFNNFAYNSLTSCVGEWLSGTDWVASGTVLVSCGISLGTFIFNPLTTWLNKNSADLNIPANTTTELSEFDASDYLFADSAERIYYRFIICGIYILVGGALFYSVSDEPPKQDQYKEGQQSNDAEMTELEKSEEKSDAKTEKLMDFAVFSDLKVWAWLIGTTLWSLMFTVPLTNGVDIITNNYQYETTFENGTTGYENMTKDTAITILSANGFIELAVRFLCIAVGPKLPKFAGSYGYIYAFNCMVLGGLTYMSTLNNTEMLAWTFFLLLPFPVGVMNGMIFGGTANIFGNSLVKTVWPFTNVLLAVGFTLGPILFSEVKDMSDIVSALRLFSIVAIIGAGVMLWLGMKAKKASK
jgi:MFS family permease